MDPTQLQNVQKIKCLRWSLEKSEDRQHGGTNLCRTTKSGGAVHFQPHGKMGTNQPHPLPFIYELTLSCPLVLLGLCCP